MFVEEVPFPVLRDGYVLVRNHFSVISAGTEGKTVKDARAGYMEKARARKEEVKKVIKSVKTHGLKETYSLVKDRLEAPSPLGYSCAGEVLEVGQGVTDLKPGDKVACGGSSANHAEIIAVPRNLCAKLDGTTSVEEAAFTTIGSIAMQGVRQADLRLGENCVVIGLGLIGQITMQLLEAGGVKPIGIDIDSSAVELAKEQGFEAYHRADDAMTEAVMKSTAGYGTDAVIITAGTSSTDPVDLAGELCRVKGKVVIVGAVNTGFKRKPYYRKELDLRMSSSYGPGRYNPAYEEHGMDYPIGYVRWTESRNMEAFVNLLSKGKLQLHKLIRKRYQLQDAKEAYDLILSDDRPVGAVMITYDLDQEPVSAVKYNTQEKVSDLVVGFIGAGKFARSFLLPHLTESCRLKTVCNYRPSGALNAHEKFNFEQATDKVEDIFTDPEINVVFIASRHQTHGQLVAEGLKHNKIVFVEKPLCLSQEELEQIRQARERSKGTVMVGFNRRFAPFTETIKGALAYNLPKAMMYRVNAGQLPEDHWVHDLKIGGGRIIGEACHFMDYCNFMAGCRAVSVTAQSIPEANKPNDSVVVNIRYEDGSIASIVYFSNGNNQMPKEYFEIACGGVSATIDDFKLLALYGSSVKKEKAGKQDKGHKHEVEQFLDAVKNGNELPVSFSDSVHAMEVTFAAVSSMENGGKQIHID